jgi:hypothetical protein
MAGRVFISCGQRGSEKEVAIRIQDLLRKDFGLDSYLAFKIQSLNDIMVITEELRKSDYYLFIDFLRHPESPDDFCVRYSRTKNLPLLTTWVFETLLLYRKRVCAKKDSFGTC